MIKVTGLNKQFRIYPRRQGILRQLIGIARAGIDYDVVTPLKNINLDVPKGRVHGIIGMNGAGKSTLLKILTGVLDPTSGTCEMQGRVAALLELGTGFHAELTGRENIFLNGAVLGFSRVEIERKLPTIIDFAELGAFFDRPVKIYSSGMYVRLAFAFAVSVEPDILIIDEALSVGDAYFQQKCLKRIQEFKDRGTTILFVSHDLGAVRSLCEQVSLMSKGEILYTGSALKALDLYNALLAEHKQEELVTARVARAEEIEATKSYVSGSEEMRITKTVLLNSEGAEAVAVVSGERVKIHLEAEVCSEAVENPTCGILIRDRLGHEVFGTNTSHLGVVTGRYQRNDRVVFVFDLVLNLGPGDFTLTVALHADRSHVDGNYHWVERALIFQVLPSNDFSFIGLARLEPTVSLHRS